MMIAFTFGIARASAGISKAGDCAQKFWCQFRGTPKAHLLISVSHVNFVIVAKRHLLHGSSIGVRTAAFPRRYLWGVWTCGGTALN